MEPAESDWYTQAGFWLSVAGVAVSTIGLSATYYQVRKARKSADAARDAAEATRVESHAGFRRYLVAGVHRQLTETEAFVIEQQWAFARLRCQDLATTFAQLACPELAKEYRYFANLFRDKTATPTKRFVQSRWDKLVTLSKQNLDTLTNPFQTGGAA